MTMIWESARQIPVWDEVDVCVVGGSCTGAFAAIRAARMGLKVVLVENQGRLGGTATAGLVYIWHTLLDDPDSYLEASATAGFAYGILKAVRQRYVGPEYADVAEKAIRGIVKNISPEGELLQTSFGTGMGSDLEFYRQIPLTSMPYGQAMAILCLTEYLRKYF